MNLSGQRNICPSCGLPFNSNAAFDKHRTGDYNKRPQERRCLTVAEMESIGMAISRGFWVTALNHTDFDKGKI